MCIWLGKELEQMANGWLTDSEVRRLCVYSKFVPSIYFLDLWKAPPHAAPPC
jgi:hypothetical protein